MHRAPIAILRLRIHIMLHHDAVNRHHLLPAALAALIIMMLAPLARDRRVEPRPMTLSSALVYVCIIVTTIVMVVAATGEMVVAVAVTDGRVRLTATGRGGPFLHIRETLRAGAVAGAAISGEAGADAGEEGFGEEGTEHGETDGDDADV